MNDQGLDLLSGAVGAEMRRARLAHEVFDAVLLGTESFIGEDQIGADLAYLLGAILDPAGNGGVDWQSEDWRDGRPPALLAVLRDCFEPDHAVWKHIQL